MQYGPDYCEGIFPHIAQTKRLILYDSNPKGKRRRQEKLGSIRCIKSIADLNVNWFVFMTSAAVLLCGPLDSPANGNVDISGPLFGDMAAAVYTCDPCFNLTTEDGRGISTSESFTRICQENGEWSGFEPTCQCM